MVKRIKQQLLCIRSENSGQSLLELTICLPFLLILSSGLSDLGLLLISSELVSDAARYGGIYAYGRSNEEVSCSQVRSDTTAQTNNYLSTVLSAAQLQIWDSAEVSTTNVYWDGLTFPYVTVTVRTNSNPSCIICLGSLLKHLNYSISNSYLPYRSCKQ